MTTSTPRLLLHRIAPFAVAIALVAAIVGVASSAVTDELDPNDTRGALDVRRIHYEWTPGAVPSWQVRSFDGWTARLLWDRGYTYVEFDTRADPAVDFYVMVYSNGRRVKGALFEVRPNRDLHLRDLKVGRPDRATVVIRFAWTELEYGATRETFRWWVTTSYTGDGCRRSCTDHAPDTGGIEEWRPGMSPTPSPTTTTTTTSSTTTTTG